MRSTGRVKSPTNEAFIKSWQAFIKNPKRVTNDPMEAHYIGFKMWAQAVGQASSTNVDAVRQAMYGQKVMSLSGYEVQMFTNHHLSKPVMIGEIKAEAWSPHIAENKGKVADWSFPWVCGNCTEPKFKTN